MVNADDAKRAWVSQVVGCELVRRVAPLFATARVPVMPLKGIWLQVCVYGRSGARVITDVDLLVPEPAYARAIDVLVHAGWRKGAGNVSETSLAHPDFELPIDLHRRLFTRGAFRMPTHTLFARASRDSSAFGVEIELPDPLDVFAHLVGHFVKSRTALDDATRLADFVAIAQRCALEPVACARRLQEVGMARAARYVLTELVDRDAFSHALLVALPTDPRGERIVALARSIAERNGSSSALGALPGFLLDRSLLAGVGALALRLLDRRHDVASEGLDVARNK